MSVLLTQIEYHLETPLSSCGLIKPPFHQDGASSRHHHVQTAARSAKEPPKNISNDNPSGAAILALTGPTLPAPVAVLPLLAALVAGVPPPVVLELAALTNAAAGLAHWGAGEAAGTALAGDAEVAAERHALYAADALLAVDALPARGAAAESTAGLLLVAAVLV